MKWMKFKIRSTTMAEDILVSGMEDIGLYGAQIEDNVPLTAAEKEQMFVDILPQGPEDDGTAVLSFYVEETEDGIISANYLGAVLLELTGRGEEDSFFQYLNEMRRELPVVSGGRYKDADGNIITKLSEDQKELVSKLQRWSYYRLTNQYRASKGGLIIDEGSE